MKIKLKTLKWLGWLAVPLLGLFGLAGAAFAQAPAVGILTVPIKVGEALYIDVNKNLVNDPNELIGTFNVYDGNEEMIFNWQPYTFASGVQGAYRVSLVQQTNPYFNPSETREIKINFHWHSEDPGALVYAFGSFGFGEPVCTYCPTRIRVQPVKVETLYDPATSATSFRYIPIAGAPAWFSDRFTLEILRICPEWKAQCTLDNAIYQKYYIPVSDQFCSCQCTLTDEICQQEFGKATAYTDVCECR